MNVTLLEAVHRKMAEDALKGSVKSAGFSIGRCSHVFGLQMRFT